MKKRITYFFTLSLLAATFSSAEAQNPTPQPSPQASTTEAPPAMATEPAARPGDVDSIEHIIAAVYDVISGPAGARDWDRFRTLYHPDGRLVSSRRNDKGAVTARVMTPDEYSERAGEYFLKQGFFESAAANRIEVFDHIAHVWSTYESRHAKNEKPFARGINSFQLIHDGTRWWILSVYWAEEDASHPLPEKYSSSTRN
jgi:hypothetical protein